ncbi:MAG: metallophosphoesterase [Erythrobacter sp.]
MKRAKGKPKVRARWILAVLGMAALVTGARAWSDTLAEPTVHRTTVAIPDLPRGTSVSVALISDIHVAGPDMPPARLEAIVTQINGLKPDIVAIAGDLVSDKRTATHIYSPPEIVAPLGRLDAPLGVIVVPGNHDHWFDLPALTAELDKYGIRHAANDAIAVGPLIIGALDDAYTGRDDIPATLAAMGAQGGGSILLSHSPDPAAEVPADIRLVLAGHTHCGQIAYPWGGAPAHLSEYGDRFACGKIVEGNRSIIVGAGLGTSLLPIRLFTRPEIWLVTLVGE